MKSLRLKFKNSEGQELSGVLELPLDKNPRHYAVFAHCFTCGKDFKAERNITLALSQMGFGVLRFDFTGLGQSEGEFADSNFSTNVEDLLAAAGYLSEHYREPELMVGHSLGGTAVLMAASKLSYVQAVATIGAPCDPDHVLQMLSENTLEEIRTQGKATVKLAGRDFTIKNQFLDDLESRGIKGILEDMREKALMVMHSPQDRTVEIENARHIYEAARHPKSYVSLDGADHLLTQKEDSHYAGSVIAQWAKRYLSATEPQALETDSDVVGRLNDGPFLTEILAGKHHLIADEPEKVGGENLGPSPYEFLSSGLSACTAMTVKMYCDRKKWPLEEIQVHVKYIGDHKQEVAGCVEGTVKKGKFERLLEVKGDFDEKQYSKILEIANKCPVHRTLEQGVTIETRWLEEY